ncbi:WD40 repeat-like protein [Phellopilus nigrolimitatus]|nr:WD40 repeat-like protein [Phellopilus nigrolimitatus]
MLHNPFSTPMPVRPTIQLPGPPLLPRPGSFSEQFSDARLHGYQGPSRSVTLQNASSPGGSAISKSQDGERCVVAGKESLRIIRVSETPEKSPSEHKFAVGKGGHRVDASRNFWAGSGLKIDSAMTDVAWCQKAYDTKILTSARNGELIIWDLHKSGSAKYERRIKGHMRAINKLSYSHVMPHYCSTGSSDGNLRVWDLRDLSKEFLYIHHTFPIRTMMFSPSVLEPLHAITGLDNGTICRWDLRMGQKGQLERVPLAHTGPVLSLDLCSPRGVVGGWLASAGLDRTVKVWDFTDADTNQSHSSTRKPAYVLHASFPVRRVSWRPGYETELAIASYNESGFNISSKSSSSTSAPALLSKESVEGIPGQISSSRGSANTVSSTSEGSENAANTGRNTTAKSGDLIEIWDVRRTWIAKWSVNGSNCQGGVSDMTFTDSHALWVQHPSGAFSQMDLRYCDKPIDSVPRSALTWTPTGSLTFVNDSPDRWEVPYDDIAPASKSSASSEKSGSHKKLGDAPYVRPTQTLGTVFGVTEWEDWDLFASLARDYRIEGADQTALCQMNAEVALDAGNDDAGRIWLLLHSSLTEIVMDKPPTPPISPKPPAPTIPHSTSAPAGVPTLKKSPSKYIPARSSSSGPHKPELNISPRREGDREPNELTPGSSVLAASIHSPASPMLSKSATGHENGERSASPDEYYKARRKSVNVASINRSPGRLSQPHVSGSIASRQNERSSTSRSRLRHVGEGALDDSDSSGSSVKGVSLERDQGTMKMKRSAESMASPGSLASSQAPRRAVSSPILREDDDWAEDEKEDSVSPASSDGPESDNSVASTTAARSSSHKRSTRSRSSTLASLAASAIQEGRNNNLQRTDSHSSVLTITARGGNPISHQPSAISEVAADRVSLAQSHKSRKRHSQVFSLASVHPPPSDKEPDVPDENDMRFLQWNHVAIKEAEERYRQTAWRALREILEDLADNGDIQMCAMMACIAPKELGIQPMRVLQFIDSYIDTLARLRMHSVSAYIRKYAPSSEVRQSSQVETVISTVCATCHKPIMQPVTGQAGGSGRTWTGYSYCLKCKKAVIECTICHLPVRTALFVCAVCSHGGHRNCYHRYYKKRPMVELASSTSESRGRRIPKMPSTLFGDIDENPPNADEAASSGYIPTVRVMGHPCAAGCGHFCWAASEKMFSI